MIIDLVMGAANPVESRQADQGNSTRTQNAVDVGQRVPHNTTALGRAYLAAMSAEQRAQRVADSDQSPIAPRWN